MFQLHQTVVINYKMGSKMKFLRFGLLTRLSKLCYHLSGKPVAQPVLQPVVVTG
jgi:hypothetical protein